MGDTYLCLPVPNVPSFVTSPLRFTFLAGTSSASGVMAARPRFAALGFAAFFSLGAFGALGILGAARGLADFFVLTFDLDLGLPHAPSSPVSRVKPLTSRPMTPLYRSCSQRWA